MARLHRSLSALCLFALVSCGRNIHFPDEGMDLGGEHVSKWTLKHGLSTYREYCESCHGDFGDGRGPLAAGMRPPPRDLRRGTIAFASVPSGRLPRNEDLVRVIRGGLHGTPMLGWAIPDDDLLPVIAYLKTFSPRWRTERPGEAITVSTDPWRGREPEGVARGEAVYHGLAQCQACHPAYESRARMTQHLSSLSGAAPAGFRDEPFASVPQAGELGTRVLPPDFLHEVCKSGDTELDLYRTIAAGVGGTAMPAWKDVLPEDDLWALVHYVHSLTTLRDTESGERLQRTLEADERAP